ncbi:craniofacial development protein 2-like [Manacus candei]|uniref:craniofacial development protein 2-like n=1 Tax=Manacus candei TaxID=415023 RepID=UPI00222718EC|nr:craniofacial development protein 2-like [Manacus candei]
MGIFFQCGRTKIKRQRHAPTSKGVPKLTLACWNIRTMLDSADSGRPEHCSALIAHELARLNIDIAALSEVRLHEEGSLREHGAGYTLFWSGKPRTEKHLSGVGFMIKNSILPKLENLLTGHSDRIISLRLPLHNNQHVVIFSIYAPTLQTDPAEKNKFYADLHLLTQKVPADDKIIILGDFNARVGKNFDAWKGILGKHGFGNCNDNGRLLLEFCAEQQLTITNTIFQQKDSLKTTWMHPRSKHWHLIDYVLVRRRDVRNVHHTSVMPSTECQTDHRLVRCKLNFNLKFKPKRGSISRRRLQVNSLQSATVRDRFQANLQTRLENHSTDSTDSSPETIWHHIKNSILQSSEESLGFSLKKNKDWFDENNREIQDLLRKKRTVHQAHLALPSCHARKPAFRLACSKLQQKLRDIQNKWWTDLAEKTQLCADTGDHKGFYEALKTAYGPTYQYQPCSPRLSNSVHHTTTSKV